MVDLWTLKKKLEAGTPPSDASRQHAVFQNAHYTECMFPPLHDEFQVFIGCTFTRCTFSNWAGNNPERRFFNCIFDTCRFEDTSEDPGGSCCPILSHDLTTVYIADEPLITPGTILKTVGLPFYRDGKVALKALGFPNPRELTRYITSSEVLRIATQFVQKDHVIPYRAFQAISQEKTA